MEDHKHLDSYKEIEKKPIDDIEFNDIPQRNKHTFVISKDFLKRETDENGKKYYPVSREMKQILKVGNGKINIKIRPRRTEDNESKIDRKCVKVTVESENVKGVKGFIQTFNQKQKHNKFKRFRFVLYNIGKPEKFEIFYHEVKSNDFLAKTKSGDDFFHLAVAVTQFGNCPSPEKSLSELMFASKELKKTIKEYCYVFNTKEKVRQLGQRKRAQNTMPSRLPQKEYPNLPSLVPSRASRLAAAKKKQSNSNANPNLKAINNYAEGDSEISSKTQADLQQIADDTDSDDELNDVFSGCNLDDASIHSQAY